MRDQDELLRRYLLGDLEEEEENRLEARLIREDDLLESVEAAEADLLEEYADGVLSPEERGRIERRLRSSPQARLRLAVIRGLGKIAQEEGRGHLVLRGPWGGEKLSRPQTRALAAAALLAIAVGSVWLGRQTVPVPMQQAVVIPTPTPVRTVPPPPPAPEAPAAVAETRPTPAPPRPVPAPYVLQLAFSLTRGEGQIEEHVIPRGTQRVELRLDLEEELAGRRFTVTLIDTTTISAAVQQTGLQAREIGGKPLLVLDLDADLLKQHMLVEIYEDGERNPLVTKEVDIRRQDG